MKELQIGELIEPNYTVIMYIDNKEYKSQSVKTDGSYIDVHFHKLEVTIPRVYTEKLTTPDENGVYFKVFKP